MNRSVGNFHIEDKRRCALEERTKYSFGLSHSLLILFSLCKKQIEPRSAPSRFALHRDKP